MIQKPLELRPTRQIDDDWTLLCGKHAAKSLQIVGHNLVLAEWVPYARLKAVTDRESAWRAGIILQLDI